MALQEHTVQHCVQSSSRIRELWISRLPLFPHSISAGCFRFLACKHFTYRWEHCISQNHSIIEWLGLEGTSRIIKLQPPCHKRGHQPPYPILDKAAQGPIQPGLVHFHNLSGQPVSAPHHSLGKELPPDIPPKSSLLQHKTISLALSLPTLLTPLLFVAPFRYWKAALRSPCSLLFSRLNKPSSLSLNSFLAFHELLLIPNQKTTRPRCSLQAATCCLAGHIHTLAGCLVGQKLGTGLLITLNLAPRHRGGEAWTQTKPVFFTQLSASTNV